MKLFKSLMIGGMMAVSMLAYGADKPEYKGGQEALDNYIATNLKYPKRAADNGIEGVVNLQFIVKTDGSIGTIKVTRLIDPDLEAEAIRLVKSMPAWIPADSNGQPVEATVTLPIKFVLD